MSQSIANLQIGQIRKMGAVAKISLEDQWQGTLGDGEQNPSSVFQAEFNPPPCPRLARFTSIVVLETLRTTRKPNVITSFDRLTTFSDYALVDGRLPQGLRVKLLDNSHKLRV